MEFVPVIAMAALTLKLVDVVRYARAGDMNGVLTQIVAWLAGVLIALLVAQTDWADGIAVGDSDMGHLNFWSLVFWGLTAGSAASLVKDTHKAIDGTNSAAIPTLLPAASRHQTGVTREVG